MAESADHFPSCLSHQFFARYFQNKLLTVFCKARLVRLLLIWGCVGADLGSVPKETGLAAGLLLLELLLALQTPAAVAPASSGSAAADSADPGFGIAA